jgi:hypothetical protein
MLLAIIQVYTYLGATDFALLSVSEISLESQKLIWLNTLLQQQGADRQIKNKFNIIISRKINDLKKEDYTKALTIFGSQLCSSIHYKPYNYSIKY